MKISFSPQKFKGYDAAPIKNLYMGTINDRAQSQVFNNLKDIVNNENINLYRITQDGKITDEKHSEEVYRLDFSKRRLMTIKKLTMLAQENKYTHINTWAQDEMFFAELNNKKYVIPKDLKTFVECLEDACRNIAFGPNKESVFSNAFADSFQEKGIETIRNMSAVKGGNFFIGKKENGEKWFLVGEDDKENIKEIIKKLEIKEENVFIIPQPAFHLDMRIRPIGYPYILVSDEDISIENNKKAGNILVEEEITEGFKALYETKEYFSGKEIAKELEKFGFKPILVGGNYANGINFMNAIVHKKENGDLIYITNSSKNKEFKEYEKFEKLFEEELRKKAPQIKKIYFIDGGGNENILGEYLKRFNGGIHCATVEEPDFEKWV